MEKQLVIKKLESLVKRKQKNSDKPEKITIHNVLSLRYVKRDNYFTNYKDSCGLKMDTMEGHSYKWYSLVKRIKGVVYLNTYRYSNNTSKHINKVRNVLHTFNIYYVELEAPSGLQNLEAALSHAVREYAKASVKYKYARIKNKSTMNYWLNQLKVLKCLGHKVTQKYIKEQTLKAESDRINKNASIREVNRLNKEAKAKEREEYLQFAIPHLAELQKNKYAYVSSNHFFVKKIKFHLYPTKDLTIESSGLRYLKPVPGTSKRACLNHLKVIHLLTGEV